MAEAPGFAEVRAAVARRLAELRRARGLTQDQAAERTGVAWRHLQRLEAGTENPTIETLYRIVSGYGASLAELFSGEVPRDEAQRGDAGAPPTPRRERERPE